jgi:hypothetical protein
MNLKRVFAAVVNVSAAIILAGMARAGCGYVTNKSGDWSDPKIWTVVYGGCSGTVPGANDSVLIEHDVNVSDSRSVQSLAVDAGKTLHITSTGGLAMAGTIPGGGTINGMLWITDNAFVTASSGPPVVVTATGTILMDGSTPRLTLNQPNAVILSSTGGALIIVDATSAAGPAYINGSGSMRSDSSMNEILINLTQSDDEVQLRLDGAQLYGAVTLENGGSGGKASFDNRGAVVASHNGDAIVLAGSLSSVTDTAASNCSSARWQAGTHGTLEIDAWASLDSPFHVSGSGNLVLCAPVTTSGHLQLDVGGCISPIGSNSFSYSGTCGGGCSPGSPITGCFCCED